MDCLALRVSSGGTPLVDEPKVARTLENVSVAFTVDIAVQTYLDALSEGTNDFFPICRVELDIQDDGPTIEFIQHARTAIELFLRLPIQSHDFTGHVGIEKGGCFGAAT